MFKYKYKFLPITNELSVYHDGTLTIYLKAQQLFWNYDGPLHRVNDDVVCKYFELH